MLCLLPLSSRVAVHLSNGHLSKEKAKACTIHKKCRGCPQNYSPILLLSIVLKLSLPPKSSKFSDIFRLINFRWLPTREICNNSSSPSLIDLETLVMKTTIVALGITGAFDRVWHQGITTKLRSQGICGDTCYNSSKATYTAEPRSWRLMVTPPPNTLSKTTSLSEVKFHCFGTCNSVTSFI